MKPIFRIGCTGTLPDIPLIVAQNKDYFPAADCAVTLGFELGWASLQRKLASGLLVAANVPPSFPLLLALKKGEFAQSLRVVALTSFHGESITLNLETAAAFQAGKAGSLKPLRIGVDSPHSLSPAFVRLWLKATGHDGLPGLQLVPVALSQLLELLQDGYIQGFCGAEPYGHAAREAQLGVTVAHSRDYPALQLQSVLVASEAFLDQNKDRAKEITAAVNRARTFCAQPKQEAEIMRLYQKHAQIRPGGVAATDRPPAPPVSQLISFAPPRAAAADPIQALAGICALLPGFSASEKELGETIRRIYAPVL